MRFKRSAVGMLLLLFALLPSDLYTPIAALLLVFLIIDWGGYFPKGITRAILPLLLMGAASLGYSISNQPMYEMLKDVWYVAKIVIIFFLGFLIGKRLPFDIRWMRTTMLIAGLAAIPGLYVVASSGSVSLSSFRVVVMGAVILSPFYWQGTMLWTRDPLLFRWIVVSPLLLTVALSLSRTTILLFLVSWFGSRGVFQSKGKIAIALVSLSLIVSIASNVLPEYDINNVTFLGKVSNSLNELSFVSDDIDTKITANWRGFEAFKAYIQWKDSSFGQMIFGQGFGTRVDIGFYYPLFGDDVPPIRFLPILHNGYAMILVKYGVFGMIMFFLFASMPLFSKHNSDDPVSVFGKRLASTAAISMMLAMPLITGPFNRSEMDGVTLLMGWAMGLQAQRLRCAVNIHASSAPSPEMM